MPTSKELQSFRKNKDRDKIFILRKQLKYSLGKWFGKREKLEDVGD